MSKKRPLISINVNISKSVLVFVLLLLGVALLASASSHTCTGSICTIKGDVTITGIATASTVCISSDCKTAWPTSAVTVVQKSNIKNQPGTGNWASASAGCDAGYKVTGGSCGISEQAGHGTTWYLEKSQKTSGEGWYCTAYKDSSNWDVQLTAIAFCVV